MLIVVVTVVRLNIYTNGTVRATPDDTELTFGKLVMMNLKTSFESN